MLAITIIATAAYVMPLTATLPFYSNLPLLFPVVYGPLGYACHDECRTDPSCDRDVPHK